MDWIKKAWEEYVGVLKQYAEFNGTMKREPFWMFVLVNFVLASLLGIVAAPLVGIYQLAILVPSLAAAVRRLHDTGRKGLLLLLALIPLVGPIILIVFLAQPSQMTPEPMESAPAADTPGEPEGA